MPTHPMTDKAALRAQYADGRTLDARSSIYAWQEPRLDLVGEVLGRIPDTARTVVDVGCGRGQYLAALQAGGRRAVGVDLSPGLAQAAATAAGAPTLVADAARLPLADDAVDAALAMHMLYHLPQPVEGLRELRRVTRSGGTVLLLTNGPQHFAELFTLLAEAAEVATPFRSLGAQFAIEHRPSVEEVLGPCELVVMDGVITLDHSGPLVRYLASTDGHYASLTEVPWPMVAARFERLVDHHITAHGTITISTQSGIFVCRA